MVKDANHAKISCLVAKTALPSLWVSPCSSLKEACELVTRSEVPRYRGIFVDKVDNMEYNGSKQYGMVKVKCDNIKVVRR